MDVTEALEFVSANHRAVMSTFRHDGLPSMSPVVVAADPSGGPFVLVSTRETAMKIKHLRHDPRASFCVMPDKFFGDWVFLEGTAELIDLPDAEDGLIEVYRQIAGEHHDWAEFKQAQIDEQRVLVRVHVERAGPNRSG